ncbi:LysR family transcriptional regulator [Streptomyces sp. XM4193]|uniref:LysR family transcriptional regulator n=1 Tax=Streptomyces sp. XM4193 TaxID=2929782 RepID=UPI001FFB4DF9|nr:LysR family transcriptional regulator [Streptomyces sp. XM4193]MCK1798377.1 LysR family transcriptional regulator [Streptomyces sp. XM4193]
MRYDLDDLRLFLHTVTEGSITAGARRMRLSLPSASARMRALERHAGVELLVRGRRGVRPTPAGSTLARYAREVLDRTAELESAVAGYVRPSTAPLTLLAGGSAMHRLVPRALASFLREHPDVDVTASESRTPHTMRRLAEGGVDLGIVLDDEVREGAASLEVLGDDSLVVIGRRGGPLAGRSALTHDEVAEHPLVGLNPDSSLRRWIEAHLEPHAVAPRYRTTVAGLGAVVSLVLAEVGLAVVPRRTVGSDLPLDICELREPWARRTHLLARGISAPPADADTATGASTSVSATVDALADHIRRAARAEPEPPFRHDEDRHGGGHDSGAGGTEGTDDRDGPDGGGGGGGSARKR